MTRAVPFTQARIERVIKAAKKQGMRVILRPDGTIILEAPDDPQNDPNRQEEKSEVVL